MNRVGDFGFLLGIFGCYQLFGTLDFDRMFKLVPTAHDPALDGDLFVFVYGGDGEIGADRAAYMACRCDGGANACLSAYSRDDDGHGWRFMLVPVCRHCSSTPLLRRML